MCHRTVSLLCMYFFSQMYMLFLWFYLRFPALLVLEHVNAQSGCAHVGEADFAEIMNISYSASVIGCSHMIKMLM